MKRINCLLLFFVTITVGIDHAFSQQLLEVQAPDSVSLVTINGKSTTYYELYVANLSSDSIEITTLQILDKSDSSVILSFAGGDLKQRCMPPTMINGTNVLARGDTSVLYIELVLSGNKPINEIAHRFGYKLKNEVKSNFRECAFIRLSQKNEIVLGPPLGKGNWAAVYEPSWPRGHRRVIYFRNGQRHIPGRYAIDFIRLNELGQYADGGEDSITNWYGYGNNVLAVADGVVSSVRTDFAESKTLSGHPKYDADMATGNYISINIGNNHFAFYEHLQPGSIKVKPGQHVRKGDIIAAIGFTGQTTGPHLHFHIAGTNSPLGAEGLPFIFDQFVNLGSYTNFENFGKTKWEPVKDLNQANAVRQRPAPNVVIKFN